MAIDITFATALGAGALSFLSPCVLPLVPPYLCYMAGVSVDDFRDDVEIRTDGTAVSTTKSVRMPLVLAAISFVLGFSTVFVALGAGASTIGGIMRAYQQELAIAAGLVIIVMGLNFLGVFRLGVLSREARFQAKGSPSNPAMSYIMGLAFAFGWTPCIGPVLGPILTMAGAKDSVADGALLLGVYSAGLGIPFLIAAFFSGAFMRFLGRFRSHMGKVEKAMGILLIIAGILFLTGGMQSMAFWLLENFPVLGTFG